MGILDQFEQGLERVVGGAFARTFKSGLQPVEITAALRRELDTRAAVVARDRILVPNRFTVHLAPGDHTKMIGLGEALSDELGQLLRRHATAQGYTFAGPLDISLERDATLREGILRIDSGTVKGDIRWTAILDVDGTRHRITASRTILGRGSDADIVLDDTGASRAHAEIVWDGTRAQIKDLGSTNGTTLDGRRLGTALLEDGGVIQIGRSRIVFRLVPDGSGVRA